MENIKDEPRDEPRDSLSGEGHPHRRERKNHKMLSTSNNNSGKPPSETGGQEEQAGRLENSVLPPEGCSPVEWVALRWEEVATHRYFKCQHYGDCLEYAGLSAWQGMSCSRCRHFIKVIRKAIG